jgi:hypothetical protein
MPPVFIHPVHAFTGPVHFNGSVAGSGSSIGNANHSGTQSNGHNIGQSNTTSGQAGGTNHQTSNSSRVIGHHASVLMTNTHPTNAAQSQSGVPSSSQHTSILPSGGYQLDLSSPAANIVLGSALFNGHPSVTINLGGTPTTFTAGNKVTAAEYVALQQALGPSLGQTPLVLSENGTADGGQFSLNKVVNSNVTSLIVPANVTALDVSSRNNANLTIAGGLMNYGTIYDVSKPSTTATISATDIINEKGGVISSVLPSALSSMAGTAGSNNLLLNASNNIINDGTISSAGSLGLSTTTGAITNSGTINAANNVNLNVGSGNLTNTGQIASNTGNINVNAPKTTDINVNALGGTFQASSGNINVRASDYNGNANINLNGGNYFSNNLNLNAGNGAINTNVGQVSGNLNSTSAVEHFIGATNNLILGANKISGDPTFVNTAGNIVISSLNTFTQDVAILASGNITANNASAQIVDSGDNVIMIAGAAITIQNGGVTTSGVPGTDLSNGGAAPSATATVNFAAGTGGNIDLTTSTAGTIISTSSTVTNGGSVTLIAQGSGSTGGKVLLNAGSTINTSATALDTDGGNVTIIASGSPAVAGNTIQIGGILTGGGPTVTFVNAGGTGGSVSILTEQAIGKGGAPVVFNTSGDITAGSIQTSGVPVANSNISIGGDINTAGSGGISRATNTATTGATAGSINIQTSGNISAQNLLAFGAGGGGGQGGASSPAVSSSQIGGNGGAGANITVSSSHGSITIAGTVNSSGGAGGGGGGGGTDQKSTFGSGGAGGSGGTAGAIILSSAQRSVSVSEGVYAGDGGQGESGQAGDNPAGGAGGGGGGSFGGGGGGGAAGAANTVKPSGAGGGGIFGGGGAGGTFGNSPAAFGGSGGNGLSGGAGGVGGTSNGSSGSLGAGGNSGLQGASFGNFADNTGLGGSNVPGFNGAAVTLSQNNDISITASSINLSPLFVSTLAIFGRTITYTSAAEILTGAQTATNKTVVNTTGSGTFTNPTSATVNFGSLSFTGHSLAILSGGGITAGTIDLSNGVGNGGNLTLIADASFTPANTNLPPNSDISTEFTISGTSGNAGNITVGAINTFAGSTAGSSAGSIMAVAFDGSISLGSVDAHGDSNTGIGGAVTVIGQGVTLGTINTSAHDAGPINVFAATPLAAGITVTNGGLAGSFINGTGSGAINLGGNLSAVGAALTGVINLSAGGNITYSGARDLILANTVTLGSTGGTLGTATSSLLLNTNNVNITGASGLATVTDVSNGETVTNGGGTGAIGGTFGFLGTGPITFASNLSAGGTFSIVNSNSLGVSNGNIVVSGILSATGAGSTFNAITNGSGSIFGTGSASATTVNLITGSGTIGTNFATPFQVAAANLAPTSTGLVSITDSQSMTLTGSGINAASSIFLSTTNNGDVTVHGQVGGNSSGVVTLSAGGSGNITANQDIHGGTLTLLSGTGNIGTLNAGALPVVSTNFSSTTGGFSNIIDTQTFTAVTVGTSQAGTSYTLSFAGPGPLHLTNITTTNGPIFVADSGNVNITNLTASTNITVFTQSFVGATFGNINVSGTIAAGNGGGNGFVNLDTLRNTGAGNSLISTSAGATITANNGAITLEQDNTTVGSINIAANTTIDTTGATGGNVNIVIGAVPPNPVVGTKPTNVTVVGASGTAFYGTHSINVPTPTATLHLSGASIVFNTGTLPATAITLGSGVSITADPSAPMGASLMPTSLSQPITMGTGSISANAGIVGAVNSSVIQSILGSQSTYNGVTFAGANFPVSVGAVNSINRVDAASNIINTANVASSGMAAASSGMAAASSGMAAASSGMAAASSGMAAASSAMALASSPMTAAFNSRDGAWISDTELVTGNIPAVLYSEVDFGIKPDVSTVIEMDESEDAMSACRGALHAPRSSHARMSSVARIKQRQDMPLTGSVTRTASGAKVINLKRGSVVFAPTRDTVVETPFGVVKIGAKSAVLLMSFCHGLAIFDLHDAKLRSVVVKAGDRELVLSPGMHAVITNESVARFEQVNPAQIIGHRHMRERAMGQGLKAFVSEFSVMQAMNAVAPLKQVVNSKHNAAQKLSSQMLKNAAILMQMNAGAYEQVTRPATTAFLAPAVSGNVFGGGD